MILVQEWTARQACLLQSAMRLTNEAFALKTGLNVRTVAAWHEKPDLVPRPETQSCLDTMLELGSPAEQERFSMLLSSEAGAVRSDGAQVLMIAVAIVRRVNEVLL